MRDIPTNIIEEFLSREYRPFWLISFTVNSTPYRITDCDVPIAVDGNLYNPRGFKIPSFRYTDKAMVDQITLVIDNLDDYFTSDFVGGTPQGSAFIVKQIFLDSDYKPIGQVTGPIGFWKFIEGLGDDVGDYSGNNKLGVLYNIESADWTVWGDRVVLSLSGAGALEYMEVDDDTDKDFDFTSGNFSVAFWAAPGIGQASSARFINRGQFNVDGWEILLGGGVITLRTYQSGINQPNIYNGFADDGVWRHFLVVRNGTTCHIYINGQEMTLTTSTAIVNPATAARDLLVGIYYTKTGFDWAGKISDLMIFDRALGANDAADLYNNGDLGGYVGPGAISQFEGGLDAWTIDGSQLKVAAKSEMARWTQQPLAYHSISCRWKKFKGTECAYAGAETWCDRTYSRCEQLGNTVNFGGFRWLPSIMDKEIWWGKVPK